VALGLIWFTGRQRAGKVLVTVAFGLLLLLSLPVIGGGLVASLEKGQEPLYPAERLTAATAGVGRHPRWIVVLGGGHLTEPRLPAIDQLSSSALLRLAEGVRLYRALPGMRMLLSGAGNGSVAQADILAEAAVGFGVPEQDLVLERTTFDTEDEATKLTGIVGKDDFLLVTTASHMPRALALFRARGADPIAAPTDYVVHHGVHFDDIFPHPAGLRLTELAEHEYLGRLWAKLRGRL
jgi:uncharacterized SAM-binding protein YcdF (DUF218 family)